MSSINDSTSKFEQVSSPEKSKFQKFLDRHYVTKKEIAVGIGALATTALFVTVIIRLDNDQVQSIRDDLTEQGEMQIEGFNRVTDGNNENGPINIFSGVRDGKIELDDGSFCHVIYRQPDSSAIFSKHAEIVGLGTCPPLNK